MEALDADIKPLVSSSFKYQSRDMVQFVPYSQQLQNDANGLTKAVLAEIPRQLTNYFSARNIKAGPK